MQIGVGTLVILCASVQCLLATPGKSQSIDKVKIELELQNETLSRAFKKMEELSPFHFMYKKEDIKDIKNLYLPGSVQTVESFLKILLSNTSLTFRQVNNQVLIKKSRINTKAPSIEVAEDNNIVIEVNKVINGQVTNMKLQPLEGVSVVVKGTTTGSTTDASGRYSINVPDNAILVFSYVGFLSQEVVIGNRTSIDVRLQEESRSLSDVVVTALGVRRNVKSLTYSTQTVNTQQLSEAREINVLASLQGKVAGLSIVSSGSGVGGDVRVVLRGNRSIDGDSQPLYIIDGVPSGGISDLSPDNIASINILKGANASALYGSDAQNGAIIIETKRGASGTHISLNQTFMIQDPYKLLPFQNVYGQGYAGTYYGNAEAAWGPKMEGQMVDVWSLDPADAGKKYAFLPQPDNKMDVFQKGYNMATSLNASMGGDNLQALLSYTYTNGKGILPNNDLKRHNISLRINSKISRKLSLDSKIEYTQQENNNRTNEAGQNINPIQQIYTMPSNIRTGDLLHYEFMDQAGNRLQNWWNPSSQTGENPYWVLNRVIGADFFRRTRLLASLTYSFTDELKLMVRTSYAGDNSNGSLKMHNNTYNVGANGFYSENQSQGMIFNNDFLLSYAHTINKDWNIKANVGGNAAKSRGTGLFSNTGLALLVPNLFSMANTNKPVTDFNPGSSTNKNSLYAFSTISWKNAIFLDFTGRNDWSSTLPEANRSYFYPSAGISAVLTDLIPEFPKTISFAKLRMSYAKVGNDTRPYMLQRSASSGPGGNNGFLQLDGRVPNPNLLPEQTTSSEIGLDVRFFEGRLGIDLTTYKTDTRNQIFELGLPVGSGATSFFTNGGNVRNKGVEAVLTGTPVKATNFNWDINLNFAANRNKVVRISDESPRIIVPGNDSYFKDFVIAQGEPYGQLYGKGWKRDDQGRVIIGSDGIPLITDGRTVLLANFNPKWTGGILNSFSYKNFSLSFVIEHRQGGTMVSASNAIIDALGLTERTLQGREGGLIFGKNFFTNETAVLEDGTPNNISMTASDFWSTVGGVNAPTAEPFVVKATNTRFRELTIGYSLPKSFLNNLHLADAKISIVGRNLFFISRASQYADPDIMVGTDKTSEGFQSYNPPSSRYYGLNLKIGFK